MIITGENENLVVGFKQVKKAIKNNTCVKIFIAEDCTSNISDSLLSDLSGIETVKVQTMRELGAMCNIDVPSSCAAIVRL